jgi:dCMP deaminase
MRPTREQWAMNLVKATAERATCIRRQVGCVLLNKRGFVLATGYNGVASGMPHCNETQLIQCDGDIRNCDTCLSTCKGGEFITPYACPGSKSPSGTNLDGCEAIHAEQNALLQCSNVHDIYECFVSCSPCITCTKLLLNTSCQNIYFIEEYPNQLGKELWERAGRRWIKFGDFNGK